MRDLLQDLIILVRVHSRVLLSLVIVLLAGWLLFALGFRGPAAIPNSAWPATTSAPSTMVGPPAATGR